MEETEIIEDAEIMAMADEAADAEEAQPARNEKAPAYEAKEWRDRVGGDPGTALEAADLNKLAATVAALCQFVGMPADLIPSGAVTEAMLADGAVKEGKIADGAVTANKIAPLSVGKEQLTEELGDSLSRCRQDSSGRALNIEFSTLGHDYRVVFNGNAGAIAFLIDGKQVFVK